MMDGYRCDRYWRKKRSFVGGGCTRSCWCAAEGKEEESLYSLLDDAKEQTQKLWCVVDCITRAICDNSLQKTH